MRLLDTHLLRKLEEWIDDEASHFPKAMRLSAETPEVVL